MSNAEDNQVPDNTPRAQGKRRQGPTAQRMKINRELAAVLRERCPGEMIAEYYLAVLEGKNPVLVKDAHRVTGWRIDHDEGREKPSLDQKMAAMKELVLRRDGQAPSHVHVQADLRAAVLSMGAGVDSQAFSALPHAARAMLVQGLRALLRPSVNADPASDPAQDGVTTPYAALPEGEDQG